MADGPQCCALEICCPPLEARANTIKEISAKTGLDMKYCAKVLDWMDSEELVFAPASAKAFIAEVALIARKHPVV